MPDRLEKLCISKGLRMTGQRRVIARVMTFANVLYLDSYSGNILLHYIENILENNFNKYKFILVYNKYKKEFRNEELLIFIVLNYYYFRINILIENILII